MTPLTSCTNPPAISPAALADLTPTGKLRVGIMYTNPVLAARDPASGDLRGIAVDLARELGRRVNVPVELVGYETTAKMLDGMQAGAWDVAFSAADPAHAEISFTAPYIDTDGTFLVPAGSALRTIADVDRSGVRVAVSAKSSLDLNLSRGLQHARLIRIPGANAAAELLIAGKAHVLAGVRQQLVAVAAKLPGSRVLDGRFMVIQQALATPKGRGAGASYLREFVEDIKASGLVAQTIEKNGIRGASVARGAPIQ